ncbi:MAG TPA: polysaccharide biosynthesis protein [Clostridiaceae bacterium]|nr:polysaccharide biosynthesis protein [Clostridiaceae bacterium]
MCRQVARFNPKCTDVFHFCENNLYRRELEMKRRYPHVIRSVQDETRVLQVSVWVRPHLVLHAAARNGYSPAAVNTVPKITEP